MLRVLFINTEYNGVAYWRMWEPARFLNKRDDIKVTYWIDENDMLKSAKEWEDLARSHDVIVIARISDPNNLATMMVVREISKKPIVMEMDDNWWDVDPNSPAYDHWKPGELAYNSAHVQCEKADFFQFSTMPIKRQMCGKFGKHDRSYIAPNLIDFDKWQASKSKYNMTSPKGKVRIGWGGSATHYSDFKFVIPVLKRVMEKYPNVELCIRGLKADFFTSDRMVQVYDTLRERMAWRHKSPLPLDRVTYCHGCHFDLWPDAVARMGMDIAIVPLVNSKFNKAKSNCRYLEFSALGIPGIYSDEYPYAETIKNGVDGYLPRANSLKQWEDYLCELIEDEKKRKEMGEAAKQKVWEQYSLQNNIGIWADMYKDMNSRISELDFKSYYDGEKENETWSIPFRDSHATS